MLSTSSAAATGLPSTRRGLLAALAAAGMTGNTSAKETGLARHPDAAVYALRVQYERTLASLAAIGPAHSRAESAFLAVRAVRPDFPRDAVERMSGLDVAAARWADALEANDDVIRRLTSQRATTFEGVLIKAQICKREEMPDDLAESVVADLAAMGGAHE